MQYAIHSARHRLWNIGELKENRMTQQLSTEAVWQELPEVKEKLLIKAQWPEKIS